MNDTRTARPMILAYLAALAVLVLFSSALGFLITTFLFAFSGGQARMVAVVNIGALVVVVVLILVAVVAWVIRSPVEAIKWTAIATGVAWLTAIIVEWILSFSLGA